MTDYEDQPLGSVRAKNNKPHKNDFIEIDIKGVFLSKSNITSLINRLYSDHKAEGGTTNRDVFNNLINKMALYFAKTTNFKEYKTADYQATNHNDWTEVLNTVNTQFKNKVYNAFKHNRLVPSRAVIKVGDYNNRKEVSYDRLTADDAKTIDFWKREEIQILNKYSRYGNSIPIWQKSMSVRHYDRNENGLRNRDPDRASLDNPVYAYNMTNIHKTLDKWDNTNWFGL